MNHPFRPFACALLALGTSLASAQPAAPTPAVPTASAPTPAAAPKREAGFKAGELAPPLSISEWVKGAPIPQLEKGKVYLVEFWATWCGPCIGNIPHLNALQKKYGKDGLVVIGFTNPDVAAGEETKRKENNTLAMVRAFVAGRGDRMDYHVAYDTADKATYKSWMNTLGGIPHAFLIDRDGSLAVNYHPFYMDDAIQQVLAGTWDNAEGYKKLRRSSALYNETLGADTYAKFQESYAAMQQEFPFLAHRMLDTKFDHARLARDEKEFLPTARAIITAAREEANPTDLSSIVRAQLRPRPAPAGPATTFTGTLDLTKLTAEQRKAAEEKAASVPPEMRAAREKTAARQKQREADEKTALKLPLDVLAEMADLACEITKHADSAALAAKAEVAFAHGNAKAAVELQTKAVALATGYAKTAEEKRLAEFQQPAPGV